MGLCFGVFTSFFAASWPPSPYYLSCVCVSTSRTHFFSFFVTVTHHPRKGRARNYHEKNSKAEHRARESPRLGSEGDEDLDEEVEKEEEERKTHSMFLCFRLSGAVVSTLRVLRKAIKRPRTRSATARPVSNAHKRDLVTNQNI